METELPTRFLQTLEQFGMRNTRVVGSRRSRVDLHIEDFLIEAQKDGLVKRGWCYIDQNPENVKWFDKLADGTWPQTVSDSVLW